MKIDEAVATKMPQIIAAVNERITGPPKKKRASSAMSSVSEVMIVRASVWLVARSMMSLHRHLLVVAQNLADAVEDDDGVVERVADDRQDRRDARQVEVDLGRREEADGQDGVVHQRRHRRRCANCHSKRNQM